MKPKKYKVTVKHAFDKKYLYKKNVHLYTVSVVCHTSLQEPEFWFKAPPIGPSVCHFTDIEQNGILHVAPPVEHWHGDGYLQEKN